MFFIHRNYKQFTTAKFRLKYYLYSFLPNVFNFTLPIHDTSKHQAIFHSFDGCVSIRDATWPSVGLMAAVLYCAASKCCPFDPLANAEC